ncbi:MAG TPA: VWA domain-containing protein, partial [Streptosporangiaceae bacterium]|nr:VWA domain-containing protein [Streptosporangiaceae bacterium]
PMPPRGAGPDIAVLAAGLGTALHAAGLPVGPDRCERLARAVTVMNATSIAELRVCALATLVSDPSQMTTFERIFSLLFGGPDPSKDLPLPSMADAQRHEESSGPPATQSSDQDGRLTGMQVTDTGSAAPPGEDEPLSDVPAVHRVASAAERLRGRDFAQLSAPELRELVSLMREMSLAVPPRRTRRYRRARDGKRPDLRGTLRQARRSGGEAIRISRQAPRIRPRRLVVLCDISGSMESYARALLMLLYCLHGGQVRGGQARPEVFSFATRLTRLTPALAASSPDTMLAKAGEAAPDWSGGTRIGAAIKEFNDHYGARGLARGAVVLIISDGWETGEPALLGEQMARLSRIAHRIVWANPRTQSPRYRPEVGGMAAAWPYCDAVVSAHSLDALADLLSALRAR